MNRNLAALVILSLLLPLTGCPPTSKLGSLSLQIDLAELAACQAKEDITITSVLVDVTREGYAPVETSLDIVGSVATGTVEDLAAGYWHISVEVYSGVDLVFTGETDVNIVAGATVEAELLFDPVEPEPTTGSVTLTVGINPLPGYKPLNQNVDKVMFSAASQRLYAFDASTKTVGVYDTAAMNRVGDVILEQTPLSIALNHAEDGLFLGYPSGRVYSLDFATETLSLEGDALTEVRQLVALSDQYILISGPGQNNADFKTINLTTGQIASTRSNFFSLNDLMLNPAMKVVYGQTVGISPADIYRMSVDLTTGAIGTITDSRYHGDFAMGLPLRFVNSYSRICAASGNTFTCAELAANDIVYAGSLGQGYNDLASDDTLGYIYQLAKTPLQKLLILDQENFFVALTVDLLGTPIRVFTDDAGIVILTIENGRYYTKVLSKASLGL